MVVNLSIMTQTDIIAKWGREESARGTFTERHAPIESRWSVRGKPR